MSDGDDPRRKVVLLEELLRGNQIRTVFQPIVDLRTGTVKGWEALSRGPSGTDLQEPRLMFYVARAKGLAFELDRHCCSTALISARVLPKDAKLFINILPSSIGEPSLVEVFEQHGMGGERIVLEIPQCPAMDSARFAEAMRKFTDRGFEVAVDRFGVRSLPEIKSLHPNYLKLWEALVAGIDADAYRHVIVESLQRMAERIGAALIATRIEREEELKFLKDVGVEYGQGWLLGRPIDTPGSAPPGESTAT